MKRSDWLLLFVALQGAPDGLDPVRIQKGMFLFAMESDVSASEKYNFKPYDYGPMSSAIYHDLDELVERGLIEQHEVAGKSWSRYLPTDKGKERGQKLLAKRTASGDLESARLLQDLKRRVAGMRFADLLESVYDKYPAYAVNSIFRNMQ